MPEQRIPFKKAQQMVLERCRPLQIEGVKLLDALGRTAAEDVRSKDDVPASDNSAMDGFAVRSADTAGASQDAPVSLRVAGEVAAGCPEGMAVRRGEAIRIMTGGVMPGGADAVMIVERTKEEDGNVAVFSPARPGDNVRRKGEDIRKGDEVLKKGALLGPAELGVLASVGQGQVGVFRRPTVAILTTGNELIDVDEELAPGRVRSSNTYTLFGQVMEAGAKPIILGKAADALDELEKAISEGLGSDILITSGGVSAGKYDLVAKVVEKMGEVVFQGVAMRPGSPMSFGRLGETLWFGLPGNPVASMVCFEQFVRPALLKMAGRDEIFRPEVEVRCGTPVKQSRGRVHFMRVAVRSEDGDVFAYPTREQGSGILTSVMLADGLMMVEPGESALQRGSKVKMQVLRPDRYSRALNGK